MGERIPSLRAVLAVVLPTLLLASCSRDSAVVEVAMIGEEASVYAQGPRMGYAAQHIRAATREGLVGLDAAGQVTPALADRWIVTEDGRSYIFRLRSGAWPEGGEITSGEVKRRLESAIREVRGTTLARDLTVIDEVRAMAGRVVEIRLTAPMPDFLQLLAQPELAFAGTEESPIPMTFDREGASALLGLRPPENFNEQQVEAWRSRVRPVRIRAMAVEDAIEAFDNGELDLVMGGTFASWPLAEPGPLSQGTVRLDPVIGLFGLRVLNEEGFLGDASRREALAMAIDRSALIEPFGIGGWTPSTRIAAEGLATDLGTIGQRWQGQDMQARIGEAGRRVAAWETANDEQVVLRLLMPNGPGSDLLFAELRAAWEAIGVTLTRVEGDDAADLLLVDRVARYASVRWFLHQFDCAVLEGPCASVADSLVDDAIASDNPATRAALLAEAEAELTAANVYIPFGQPIRWSLVRGSVDGFEPNLWAFHPLPSLAAIPN